MGTEYSSTCSAASFQGKGASIDSGTITAATSRDAHETRQNAAHLLLQECGGGMQRAHSRVPVCTEAALKLRMTTCRCSLHASPMHKQTSPHAHRYCRFCAHAWRRAPRELFAHSSTTTAKAGSITHLRGCRSTAAPQNAGVSLRHWCCRAPQAESARSAGDQHPESHCQAANSVP